MRASRITGELDDRLTSGSSVLESCVRNSERVEKRVFLCVTTEFLYGG